MSHVKYTTDAFVIASKESGEADRIFKLYTKEFGMIFAIAKSVRLLKSKLKSHLVVGGRTKISLVKGKEFWRLVEAEKVDEERLSIKSKKHFAKIMAVLSRLIHGEEKNDHIYETLADFKDAISTKDILFQEGLELIALVKILSDLGYFPSSEPFKKIYGFSFSEKNAEEVSKDKIKIIDIVNKALLHSHL